MRNASPAQSTHGAYGRRRLFESNLTLALDRMRNRLYDKAFRDCSGCLIPVTFNRNRRHKSLCLPRGIEYSEHNDLAQRYEL